MNLPDREPDLTPVDPGRPEILRRVRMVEAQVRATGTPDAPSEVQRVAEAILTGAGAVLGPVALTVLEALRQRAREEIEARVRKEIATRTGVDL